MTLNFLSWLRDERASLSIEAGFIVPVMMTLLLGTLDVGQGILLNQKVINASQMIGDLLAREDAVTTVDITNAIEAGRLTLMPYDAARFGADVAGIQFVSSPNTPQVVWRETVGMDVNATILDGAVGLGEAQEGVLGVTVQYTYAPRFARFLTGDIVMAEVTYARPRRGLFIPRV